MCTCGRNLHQLKANQDISHEKLIMMLSKANFTHDFNIQNVETYKSKLKKRCDQCVMERYKCCVQSSL